MRDDLEEGLRETLRRRGVPDPDALERLSAYADVLPPRRPNRLRNLSLAASIVVLVGVVLALPREANIGTSLASPSASAAVPSGHVSSPSAGASLTDNTRVTCDGQMTFPASGLDAPPGAENASGLEFDALRAAFALYAGAFPDAPDWSWRLSGRDDSGATFLAKPEGFGASEWISIEVMASPGGWHPAGIGVCQPHVVLSAEFGPATWGLDPAFPPPEAASTVLHVLVSERACHGLEPATGRMSAPLIVYAPKSLTVTIGVRPLGGAQTCPMPPGTPDLIQLAEPLGDRTLLDGGIYPPAPPSPGIAASGPGITVRTSPGEAPAAWSPDGLHLLVVGDDTQVIDTAGQTVASHPGGMLATWIDATRYAVWSPPSDGSDRGTVVVFGLDGESEKIAGAFGGLLLGNGAGAITLMPFTEDGSPGTFVVWKDGVLSRSRPGVPLGWSRNGSLIVVTSGVPTGGTAGSGQSVPIRILRYPSFKEAGVVSGVQVDPNYPPAFSADDSRVAFQCGWKGSDACRQLVVDVATGQANEVANQARGLPLSWLPNGHLLLAHADSPVVGPLEEWDGSKVVPSALPQASWAIASRTGSVALITQSTDETHTTKVLSATGQPLFDLPGMAVLFSPDGSQLVVEADDHQAFVLLTVP